jgi:hypothetical protein
LGRGVKRLKAALLVTKVSSLIARKHIGRPPFLKGGFRGIFSGDATKSPLAPLYTLKGTSKRGGLAIRTFKKREYFTWDMSVKLEA